MFRLDVSRLNFAIALFCLSVLCLDASASCCSAQSRSDKTERENFNRFAVHVLNRLSRVSEHAFDGLISSRGLILVTAEMDRHGETQPKDAPLVNGPGFKIGHRDATSWSVTEIEFSRKKLGTKECMSLSKQVSSMILHTRQSFSTSISYSINMRGSDVFKDQSPCMNGKVAAGEMWYVYFRKERAGWKVWRIENIFH
ncbi:MAG: hypothetical protein ABJA67_05370 [Chthonomonadales bacterium]